MELSISHKLFKNIKNNRWQHEFSDREKIGAGGFSSVYKVKNCYDDQMYAVKKVKLQFNDIRRNFDTELQKVLDEAKFLAKVKHENILRYYGSWLEATTRPNNRPSRRGLTVKPSIFKKEKENVNSLNRDGLYDLDREHDLDVEEGSPLVVFDETDKAKDNEESVFDFHDEEKTVVKNESLFARRPSKFNNRRPQLHLQEGIGLKLHPNMRAINSQPEGCSTPLVRGEKLENIMLFIQTELCTNTLESYIDARNSNLQDLKKQNSEEYMKKRKEYLREALTFAKQILNGLSHIHSHQVVHRDLKPSNIFIAGKTCKIGDFGLVKQLVSLFPLENSPCIERVGNNADTSFQDPVCCVKKDHFCLLTKKSSSDTICPRDKTDSSDNEDHITKSIGTRMYASPEQWMADKDTFDYRADIFSLGVCFLLLFHPMSTYMERTNIIKNSKAGNIPEGLEKELPEIAEIIKKMLSLDPASRPSIEKISQSIKLPCEIKSQLCGSVSFRKENALRWRKKYFKIIDGNLHLYNRENEKKAENVYTLSHWHITLERNQRSEERKAVVMVPNGQSEEPQAESLVPKQRDVCIIKLENSDQLGCEFKLEGPNATGELFKAFEEFKGTC